MILSGDCLSAYVSKNILLYTIYIVLLVIYFSIRNAVYYFILSNILSVMLFVYFLYIIKFVIIILYIYIITKYVCVYVFKSIKT